MCSIKGKFDVFHLEHKKPLKHIFKPNPFQEIHQFSLTQSAKFIKKRYGESHKSDDVLLSKVFSG